jgi:hypothetical protein
MTKTIIKRSLCILGPLRAIERLQVEVPEVQVRKQLRLSAFLRINQF